MPATEMALGEIRRATRNPDSIRAHEVVRDLSGLLADSSGVFIKIESRLVGKQSVADSMHNRRRLKVEP